MRSAAGVRPPAPVGAVAGHILTTADPVLAALVSNALQSSVVPTTYNTYNSATRQYIKFCTDRCLPPFPVDRIILCAWILYMAMSIKVSSLKMYLAGVRFTQELRGEVWDLAGNDLVRRTLRYVKRRYPVVAAIIKFPVSLDTIRAFFPTIHGWPYDLCHDDHMCVAATLLGICGFLRGGEFLTSPKSCRPMLRYGAVTPIAACGVTVKVRQPKARWWVAEETVTCWSSGAPAAFNVYDRMMRYRASLLTYHQPNIEGPAFESSQGVSLSRDVLVEWTRILLAKAGVSFISPTGA